MHIAATAFAGTRGKSSVVVAAEISGASLQFNEANGTFNNDLDLAVWFVDRRGRSVGGDRTRIVLHLRPELHARAQGEGVRVVSRFDVPPGTYRLSVTGVQAPSGVRGSALADLTVPDFSKDVVALGGIVLASNAESRMLPARADGLLDRVIGSPVSAAREFSTAGDLLVYTELYERRRSAGRVSVEVTIKDENGSVVGEAAMREIDGGQPGRIARISLRGLASGEYSVTVDARSDAPGVSISRSLVFRVK